MKVFWSWQSDTPGEIGRYLVRDALNAAIKALRVEADVTEPEQRVRQSLHLDHDRKNEQGSPDLARVIFDKIAASSVVVSDVTPVGSVYGDSGKKLLNSNVAIELGFALHRVTDRAIIMVMNSHYGRHEDLPFNVRGKAGPITFKLASGAGEDEIAKVASQLKRDFIAALRPYLGSVVKITQEQEPFPTILPEAGYSRWVTLEGSMGMRDGMYSPDAPAGDLFMQWKPEMWFRLMPVAGPSRNLRVSAMRDAIRENGVVPLAALRDGGSMSSFRPPNGAGLYMTTDPAQISKSVVALFGTGELWAIDQLDLGADDIREGIPSPEPLLRKALAQYSEALAALDIRLPLRWIVGMRGIRGRPLVYPATPDAAALSVGGACVADFVFQEGVINNESQMRDALVPFFDDLFEQCGLNRPKHLDRTANPI